MKFFGKGRRSPETRTEKKVRFLCEQDGTPERKLKELLAPELISSGVERAYLARVEYGRSTEYEVALCLRAREDPSLVARIAEQFATLFGRHAHMDILFLDDSQEAEVTAVCTPFFRAV